MQGLKPSVDSYRRRFLRRGLRFLRLFTAGKAGLLAASLLVVSVGDAQGSYGLGDGISALGFGEIDYRQGDGSGLDGFLIGQTVLQLTARLDDRLSFFTEMTATAKQGQDFEFEIERAFLRYDFSDRYKLSVGRYHLPLGYWNASFHHGTWLQTTVARPQVVKFGSNVVPIHFNGILLEGSFLNSGFGYRAGIGNGRSSEINDPGDFGDTNNNTAWLISGSYRPVGRYMMNVGFSIYGDKASPAVGPEVDEIIYSGYFVLRGESPEVIVEYHYATHDRTNTIGLNGDTEGGYAQIAYRLPGDNDKFKPYFRAERVRADNDDALLGGLGLDYDGILAGLRWDFSSVAAIKAEYRNEEFNNAGKENSVWLQISFVLGSPMSGFRSASDNNRNLFASLRPGNVND